jgi:hypothetical protein
MDSSTGCISIGVSKDSGIQVDRVVEFFEPASDSGVLWVDVFFSNPTPQPQSISILHRGNFSATDVTRQSWSAADSLAPGLARSLTGRLKTLHEDFDPIRTADDSIIVAGIEYRLPEIDPIITCVVDVKDNIDTPFTMWDLHGFPGPRRQLFRLRLEMGRATFSSRMGEVGEFYAYGEAILLNKIQCQDLPSYEGPCAEEFRQAFNRFQTERHVVPDKFEYLLVWNDVTDLGWEATALSANLSTRWISDPDLRRNTLWFVADIEGAAWSLGGSLKQNSYALRFTSERVVSGALASVANG